MITKKDRPTKVQLRILAQMFGGDPICYEPFKAVGAMYLGHITHFGLITVGPVSCATRDALVLQGLIFRSWHEYGENGIAVPIMVRWTITQRGKRVHEYFNVVRRGRHGL